MSEPTIHSRIEMYVGGFSDYVFDRTNIVSINIENDGLVVDHCGIAHPLRLDWDDVALALAAYIKQEDLIRKMSPRTGAA